MIPNRLSRRLRWLDHEPMTRVAGDLYFRVEMPGRTCYIRVHPASKKRARWWLEHILRFTHATTVEVL